MGQWLDSLTGWLSANPQWLGLAIFLVSKLEGLAIPAIIVPGPLVAAGMTLGRYLPRSAYIKIAAHQQQKKLYR